MSVRQKYLSRTKSNRKVNDLVIRNYSFEAVSQFSYLGMTLSSTTDTVVAI